MKTLNVAMMAMVLGLVGCASKQRSADGTTTVILVRHAEKADEPAADPGLTPAGATRAKQLIDAVGARQVSTVFTSMYARSVQTAEPLAMKVKAQPEVFDPRDVAHVQLITEAVNKHRGETILIVGHSNTVPELIAALGAPKPAAICEGEYDGFYVVTIPASGAASVEAMKYGTETVDASCRTNN